MKWFRRKEAEGYVCRVCGKVHGEMPTDYGWQLPDILWKEPSEVRQQHLDWSTDVSYFDGRWFLRGVLEVPFRFQPGRFGFGVWAEVSEETMSRYRAHWEGRANISGRDPGILANQLSPYPESLGLPVEVEFGPPELRPLIFVAEGSEHLLAREQRDGISEERYHEIVNLVTPNP